MIEAVLFDVGGVIDTEEAFEQLVDHEITALFAEANVRVSPERYQEANDAAVAAYAPNAYQAIVWNLARGDRILAERIWFALGQRAHSGDTFQLRDGVTELLAELYAQDVKLGIVANQPAATLTILDAYGLGGFFGFRQVSSTLGLRKPDTRLFLAACEGLGVAPERCVMVGDRIDNDIAPAKALGMTAIRFRGGRHVAQAPRSWTELPDAEVTSIDELRQALARWITLDPA
ncbi:MAG: HAD family hydrolase [Alphaproteobacteria bacterium]|nr:HAD family hydrolase [Alphaproteobacteria bacterium]